MSVTWDDTVNAGGSILASWANDMISAMKTHTPAKFVVSDDKYGEYYCNGTADNVRIEEAVNDLTAGRTWYEKVLVKGDLAIAASITLPSYTILDLTNAKLTLGDGLNTDMINLDATTVNHVLVTGGVLDCNKANQTGTSYGIWLDGQNYIFVEGVRVFDAYTTGIQVKGRTYDSTRPMTGIFRNNVSDSGYSDITANGDYLQLVYGNTCKSGERGILISGCHMAVANSNICYKNNSYGLYLAANSEDVAAFNTIASCSDGIRVGVASNHMIFGNTISACDNGVQINNSDACIVDGNLLRDNSAANLLIDNDSDNNIIVNNILDTIVDTPYCIRIANANCANNIFRHNIIGGAATANVSDLGTNTDWESVKVPFVDGSVADDRGWDIDGAAEYARAYAFLPTGLQEIIRIKIYAMSVVTEADAMRLEIAMNGAADNEAYNTEAISVVDKASTSSNFAANDIIYWIINSSDDSDIADLAGGDSLDIKVLHEAAGGDDCATDARFRTVEIQYV